MKKPILLLMLLTVFFLSGKGQMPDKLTAKLDGDNISLSDGRTFVIKKTKLFGAGAELEMKAPLGATVIVTQDDGKDIYRGEVPFTYAVKDFELYDKYFKLEVTEGTIKWSIKLKNDNGNRMIIEEGAAMIAAPAAPTDNTGTQMTSGSGTATANAGPSDWAFFSEAGENFTMYIDGEKINASPSQRVTASNLTGNSKEVRIEFENSAVPKLTKRFPVIPGGTTSVAIKKNKKGEYQFKVMDAPRQE